MKTRRSGGFFVFSHCLQPDANHGARMEVIFGKAGKVVPVSTRRRNEDAALPRADRRPHDTGDAADLNIMGHAFMRESVASRKKHASGLNFAALTRKINRFGFKFARTGFRNESYPSF
jgi:hypothetical protein